MPYIVKNAFLHTIEQEAAWVTSVEIRSSFSKLPYSRKLTKLEINAKKIYANAYNNLYTLLRSI